MYEFIGTIYILETAYVLEHESTMCAPENFGVHEEALYGGGTKALNE